MSAPPLVAGLPQGINGTERHSWPRWAILALLVVGGLASAYLTAFADGSLRLVGPGLLAMVVVVLVAGYHAYGLILALLVTRSSLDWFVAKDSGLGSTPVTGFQPAIATGAAVLVVGFAWLSVQLAAGRLRRPSATGWALFAFMTICLLTSLDAKSPGNSLATSLRVAIGAVVFLMVEQVVLQDIRRIRSLLIALGLSLFVPALFGFNELLNRSATKNWVQGPFVNRNTMAIWLSILVPLFVAVRPHVAGWARFGCNMFIGVGGFLLLFTYTRAAWIGAVVGLIVVGLLQDRRLVFVSLAVVAGLWLLVPSVSDRFSDLNDAPVSGEGDPNSLAFRERYWRMIWDEHVDGVPVIQNVTGIGLGMVEEWSPYGLEPHNLWVQAVAETGVVGSVALVVLVVSIGVDQAKGLRRLPNGLHRAVVIGAAAGSVNLLTQSYTQNLITEALLWTYLATVLAAAAGLARAAPARAVAAAGSGAPAELAAVDQPPRHA